MVFTPPSVPPFAGEPKGRRGKPPYSVLEPLRYKVGGPSKVCARLCGLGPPGGGDSQLLVDVRMVVVLDLVGCINGSRDLMTLEK